MPYLKTVMLTNVILLAVLGFFVLWKGRRTKVNLFYFFFNETLSLFYLGVFLGSYGFVSSKDIYENVVFTHIFSSLTIFSSYYFALFFTGRFDQRKWFVLVLNGTTLVSILGLIFYPKLLIEGLAPRVGITFFPVAGPLYVLYMLNVFFYTTANFIELFTFYRQSDGYKRNQAKYVLLGYLVCWIGTTFIVPPSFGKEIPFFGFFIIPLHGVIFVYALVRYRLMDINILFSRSLFSILVLTPVIFFQVFFVSFLRQQGFPYFLSNAVSVTVIALFFIATPFSRVMRTVADQLILKGQYNYQDALRNASKAMVSILDVNELLKHIVALIVFHLGVERIAILLENESKTHFEIRASHGLEEETVRLSLPVYEGPLVFLKRTKSVFVKAEMEKALSETALHKIYSGMESIGAEVIVPFFYKNEINGLLCLGNKISGNIYNQSDLDVLEGLANTAAVSIQNAALYNEVVQMNELLKAENFERKKVEEKLRDGEERFRALTENTSDLIWEVDRDMNYRYVSPKIHELLGREPGEFIGKSILSFMSETDQKRILLEIRKGVRYFVNLECALLHRDGRWVTVEINGVPYFDLGGELKGYRGISRDISERKGREEIKAEFLAMISHEMRTPLYPIRESIKMTLEGLLGTVTEEQKDVLMTTRMNIDRLVQLLNNFLDFQKLEAGMIEFRPVQHNMNDIVREIKISLATLTQAKGLSYNLFLDESLPKVACDRDKIVQVLMNLINNAVRFTKEGAITIRVSGVSEGVRVSVEDTGIGIQKEERARLFKKFEQLPHGKYLAPGGTGLGLFISKKIIEGHGGKIDLDSRSGSGSCFYFILPFHSPASMQIAKEGAE